MRTALVRLARAAEPRSVAGSTRRPRARANAAGGKRPSPRRPAPPPDAVIVDAIREIAPSQSDRLESKQKAHIRAALQAERAQLKARPADADAVLIRARRRRGAREPEEIPELTGREEPLEPPPASASLDDVLLWMFNRGLPLPRGLAQRPERSAVQHRYLHQRNAAAAAAIARLAGLGRVDLAERTLVLHIEWRLRPLFRVRGDREPALTAAPFHASMEAHMRAGAPDKALEVHRLMVQYGVADRPRTVELVALAHVEAGDAEAAIRFARRAADAGVRLSRNGLARLVRACARSGGGPELVEAALALGGEPAARHAPTLIERIAAARSSGEIADLVSGVPGADRPSENLGRAVVRAYGRAGDVAAAARYAHRAATDAERAGRPLPLGAHAALYDEFLRLCAARCLPAAAAGALVELRKRHLHPSKESFRALFHMASVLSSPSASSPSTTAFAAGPITIESLWVGAVAAGVARRPDVYRAAVHAASAARDVPALQRFLRDLSLDPAGPTTGAHPSSRWASEGASISAAGPSVAWEEGDRARIVGRIAAAMCRARDFRAAKRAIVGAGLQGNEQVLVSLVRGLNRAEELGLATEAVAYMAANGVAPSKCTADELLRLCARAREARRDGRRADHVHPSSELRRAGVQVPNEPADKPAAGSDPVGHALYTLEAAARLGGDRGRRTAGDTISSAVVGAALRRVGELMGLADDAEAVRRLFGGSGGEAEEEGGKETGEGDEGKGQGGGDGKAAS
eukprot:tig00020999_g16973.t1